MPLSGPVWVPCVPVFNVFYGTPPQVYCIYLTASPPSFFDQKFNHLSMSIFHRFLWIFGPTWPPKTLPKSIPNPSKIYFKRHLKQDTILDRSWKALGRFFGRFWPQVGGQVGAKLALKSEKKGYQDDVKKSSKI